MKNLTSTNVRFIALMVLCTISMAAASQGRRPQAPSTPAGAQAASTSLSWALVIQQDPEPKVVTDVNLRNAIIATGLPWLVRDKATRAMSMPLAHLLVLTVLEGVCLARRPP